MMNNTNATTLQQFIRGDPLAVHTPDALLNRYMSDIVAKSEVRDEEPYLEQLLSRHTKTRQWLQEQHTCTICKMPYTEANNIGRWQCRRHLGYWDVHVGHWTCCFLRLRIGIGCMRSDHVADLDMPSNTATRVPRFLQPLMQEPRAEAGISENEVYYAIVDAVREEDALPHTDYRAYLLATSVPYARADYLTARREHDAARARRGAM